MPLVTTEISYEHEEFGRREASTFKREVADLYPEDALWYCVKIMESLGYDCAQLNMVTSDGKTFKTDW